MEEIFFLGMLTDDDIEVRKSAVNKIINIRNDSENPNYKAVDKNECAICESDNQENKDCEFGISYSEINDLYPNKY